MTKFSIATDRGKIVCPHCGLESAGDPNSLFLTHALSVQEEAKFGMDSAGLPKQSEE